MKQVVMRIIVAFMTVIMLAISTSITLAASPASSCITPDPAKKFPSNTYTCSNVNPFDGNKDPVELGLPIISGHKSVSNAAAGGAITEYLIDVLKLVTSLVGGIIVLMVVIAGIQYIISMGDPGNIKSAKDRLQNAIIALVLFVMTYAIISFLVPGGIAP